MKSKAALRNLIRDIWPILTRNIFTLINVLIATLALLLWWFGDSRDALFVASVVTLNAVVGIIQELRARFALEKLQALAIQKVMRIESSGERLIAVDRVGVGDHIRIKLGDQIPADSKILTAHNIEVNEALLTGESVNLPRREGDELLGGSFVVAGSGVIEIVRTPEQSFIGKMTDKIKRYHFEQSPIQKDLTKFIRVMTYILLVLGSYVVVRGISAGANAPSIIKQIAVLAGFVVPEGLLLAATLLFAYGAIRMLQRKVLLQQINATEKLGRMQVICVDKTGTLTENTPVFDQVKLVHDVTAAEFDRALASYVASDSAETQTIASIKDYIGSASGKHQIIDSLGFSSRRKYGAVTTKRGDHYDSVFVGAPDILLLACQKQSWVKDTIDEFAKDGKRLILVAKIERQLDLQKFTPDLNKIQLKPLGMVVLSNPLKKGTTEIIDFFRKRNVIVKLISGDNPLTVAAIARRAGIEGDEVVTGEMIKQWRDEDFAANVDQYNLYARILPEQKELLVKALQTHNMVAMIGDGANDAMAIKQADLGVAMFEGSSAARQVADIVLMNNTFSDLPRGVRLSDSIITTIELVASLFFNKVVVGLILFAGLALTGNSFALVPRNMTVINYFIIGFPVFFWSLWPRTKRGKASGVSLFRAALPFALSNGLISALITLLCYMLSIELLSADKATSQMMLVVCLLTLGVGAILFAPITLRTRANKTQNRVLFLYFILVCLIFTGITLFAPTAEFFDLSPVAPEFVALASGLILIGLITQYFVAHSIARRLQQ